MPFLHIHSENMTKSPEMMSNRPN